MARSHSSYLGKIFDDRSAFKRTLSACKRKIKKVCKDHGIEFDAIACRGTSGISVASPLALAMDKDFIVVRKDDDQSHAEGRVEGLETRNPVKYIIVDDFCSSGKTVNTIKLRIDDYNPQAECVGYLFYDQDNAIRFFAADAIASESGWNALNWDKELK